MAIFRPVQTDFWTDVKVSEDMTPEDKLFMVYLLTNPHTTQLGVYEITPKIIAFEIGVSIESARALLDRFENHHKLIKYNKKTREIAIKNWGKYNLTRGGKPIEDCLKKEIDKVKDLSLVQFILEKTENEKLVEKISVYAGFDDTSTIRGTSRGQKEEEKEEEKEKKYIVEIVNYLNTACEKNYRTSTKKTRTLIKARLAEDYTVADLKKVIDIKKSHWFKDPKWDEYLRPETLFGTKFESYLNSKAKVKQGSEMTAEERLKHFEQEAAEQDDLPF
ncbi:conserved phage C-terminal domain-containing protein [Bacillus sp. NPDC077411]|uniref:conserved phage C-terminal domain-containing protein n=1 Tax=Bacillus sp. NPDC077411 TaxID=3363947 RepID=UPI0037CC34CA